MRRAVQQTAAAAEVVQREIRIDAAPATVFEFLTDPAASMASTSTATSASAAR